MPKPQPTFTAEFKHEAVQLARSSGQTFPLLSQHVAWGEERVFFPDPQTHELRSLPLSWTNLAQPDPFHVLSEGKAVLRFRDLQQLMQFLKEEQAYHQEDH